jgi:aspartate-semialdehyde dehydrogenase
VVIDNSSLYRYDPDVPLIVPEVNPEAVDGYRKKNIIANPNCSTAQMVVALKPLHDRAKIKRVVVSTYQSVSGAGKEGMDELWDQTKGILRARSGGRRREVHQADRLQRHSPYRRLHGGRVDTKEEWKMVAETKKIVDPKIKVTATCVRVPVFVGHSEAINIEFEEFLTRTRRARSCARRPASWSSTSARTAATSRPSNASATTPPSSAASARIRRSRTG